MDERNLEPEEPGARLRIDELGALRGERIERGAEVCHLVRDVVHPRPSLREELAHGRLLSKRGKQLDAPVADQYRRGFDTLLGHGRAVLDFGAEQTLVCGDRVVEVLDGDAKVMNPTRVHAGDATGRALP